MVWQISSNQAYAVQIHTFYILTYWSISVSWQQASCILISVLWCVSCAFCHNEASLEAMLPPIVQTDYSSVLLMSYCFQENGKTFSEDEMQTEK